MKEKGLQFLEQGNYTQALHSFRELDPSDKDAEIQSLIRFCQVKMARKYWRQGKSEAFDAIVEILQAQVPLALASASMKGALAFQELAEKNLGEVSTLGFCASCKELKIALLHLRHEPSFKSLAEGWVALLKDNINLAKEMFVAASAKKPLHGEIALGVCALLEGNVDLAEEKLSSLRPYASRKFPILEKAMKWNVIEKKPLPSAFDVMMNTSLEDLLKLDKLLNAKEDRELKGWVKLRIGDYFAQQEDPQAFVSWDKAYQANPALKLDVFKRRFLINFISELKVNNPRLAFFEFYNALCKDSKESARSFVEYFILNSGFCLESCLSTSMIMDIDQWKNFSIDPVLLFLWLHLAYREAINYEEAVLRFPSNDPSELMDLSQDQWLQIFQKLDGDYGHLVHYMTIKLAVAKILKLSLIIQESVFKLLKSNPNRKEELLPLYVIEIFAILDKNMKIRIDEETRIKKQIQELRQLYPHDFDLIRLTCLLSKKKKSKSSEEVEANITAFRLLLSDSLYQVLKLQAAIDEGLSVQKCKALEPQEFNSGLDPEADWRLFAALSTPKLKMTQKALIVWMQNLAPTCEAKHALFSRMASNQLPPPPFSLLKHWINHGTNQWYPYYHLALYHHHQGDQRSMLQMLRKTKRRLSPDSQEMKTVDTTLTFYSDSDRPNDFQELMDIFGEFFS